MENQIGYEVSVSSFHDLSDPVPASSSQDCSLPSLAMSSALSSNDLRMVTSSSSSTKPMLRTVSSDNQSRRASKRKVSPQPSFVDVFQVVTRDFFRQYSCTHSPVYVVVPPNNQSKSQQKHVTDSRDTEVEGIEFDEDEILRRDYELSRV
jgi:hypothetical protein